MVSTFEREVGSRAFGLQTGLLAQQANGSVVVSYGDCVMLVTATMDAPREGIDFFPLTVDFEERQYARGKIPGSFFRREGRPSADAVLTDRLTDRSIRPLFPDGFRKEVQVIATPFSADLENPLDILVMNGASAALTISDIPFDGPIGATRIGSVDGRLIVNPSYQQIQESELDLVVAGSRDGVIMMEAGVNQMADANVVEAIRLAQQVNLEQIQLQEEMRDAVGLEKAQFETESFPEELVAKVESAVAGRVSEALEIDDEDDRGRRLDAIREQLVLDHGDDYSASDVGGVFKANVRSGEKKLFRERILNRGVRPDGRGLEEIRAVSCDVGILPRTHGSGLFSRGETQILGVVTLGSPGDAQRLDNLSPQEFKRFMLHYNFPPYSTGEAKRIMSPGRREVGHGALAERALTPVLPDEEDFPYVIRIVAEALSSNGSTSMGSVCAGTLALMDAGVPLKAAVAGISVGLVVEPDGRFVTMTDIQGLEDHAGDMDFKVAGTRDGITAIQLDIKVKNIGFDVIEAALAQAKEARLFLLDRMQETIAAPRDDLSEHAPRMTSIKIPVDKIGAVIGPGGKTIRGIVEETGATVDVEDDGTIIIGSSDGDASRRAIEIIEGLTKEAKVGEIYTGKVVRILDFGAFVEILPGKDGMVHISELADYHVPSVEDVVQLGEEITVKVKGIDASGRIALSRRALLQDSDSHEEPAGSRPDEHRPGNGSQGGGRPSGDSGPRDQRSGGRRGGAGGGDRGGASGGDRGGPGGGPRPGGYRERRPPPR